MKRKNNEQKTSAERPLLIRFSVLVLAIWLLVCSLVSLYVVEDMRRQLSNNLQKFGQEASFTHYFGLEDGPDLSRTYRFLEGPGGAYDLCYDLLMAPLSFMTSSKRLTLSVFPSNDKGPRWPYQPFFVMWSNDHPEIVYTSENSAAFYYSIFSGSREDGATEGYCTSPNWNSRIASEYKYTTYTGYFMGDRFVFAKEAPADLPLIVIAVNDDSIIHSDDSIIFQYRMVEGTLVGQTIGGATEGYCHTNNWYGKEQYMNYSVYRGYFVDDHFIFAEDAPAEASLVDIAISNKMRYNEAFDPCVIGNRQYDDLITLAEGLRFSWKFEYGNWNNKVMYQSGQSLDNEYIWLAGYVYQPVLYVCRTLLPFFLVTFVLSLIIIHLLMRRIRNRFLYPIQQIVYAKNAKPYAGEKLWTEAGLLKQQFYQMQQQLAEANAEVQRLNTALEYAADAEENRRQLVSNLTHELKTPLAVIHSYAEGLQAGIAKDKQDRYLSIITEESERMDAMVLEMLDLSRLEAGKVRLSADRFSLLAMARTITDKFAPLMEAKELTLLFEQAEDITIIADEGRMTQAITNLVSNAFKYATQGSQICVRVGKYSASNNFLVQPDSGSQSIRFSIENASEPIPEEKLSKVWDSFYRTDPSRNEPGTGLGLAIVKSIVMLHRGECFARNTLKIVDGERITGVEFGFALPLN